jgi:hypothetical protein
MGHVSGGYGGDDRLGRGDPHSRRRGGGAVRGALRANVGQGALHLGPWYSQRTGYSSSGSVAEERSLQVTFENGKDLPVIVSEMRVEFYKEDKPLEAWTRPNLAFVDEREHSSPLGPVNIPPHESRQRTDQCDPRSRRHHAGAAEGGQGSVRGSHRGRRVPQARTDAALVAVAPDVSL